MTNITEKNGSEKILLEKVLHTIQHTKGSQCTGPDEIPIELLKPIKEGVTDIIVRLFTAVYSRGIIPIYRLIQPS